MISRFARGGVAAAVLAAALLTSSCSSTTRDAATITYNDDGGEHTVNISQSDFEDQLRDIGKSEAAVSQLTQGAGSAANSTGYAVDMSLATAWLDQLVTIQAAKIEAERLGVQVTDADVDEARQNISGVTGKTADMFAEGQALQAAVAGATPTEPTDEEVREFYDQNEAALTECHGAAYFLGFGTFNEAQTMVQQIEAMEGDIDEVWQSADAQPSCLNILPDELKDAVEAADPGAVVGPIAFGNGYFVLGRTEAFTPSFEYWQPDIEAVLGDPQSALTFRKFLMTVHVNPKYGTWKGALLQVQAPVVPQPNTSREGNGTDVLVPGDLTTG